MTKTEAEGTHIWVIEAGLSSRAQRFTGDGQVNDSQAGRPDDTHIRGPANGRK